MQVKIYLKSRQQAPGQRQHPVTHTTSHSEGVCSGLWWADTALCTLKEGVYYSTSKTCSMQPGCRPASRIHILSKTNENLCRFRCPSYSEMHFRRLRILNWILHETAKGPSDFANYCFQLILKNGAPSSPTIVQTSMESLHLCQKVIFRNPFLSRETPLATWSLCPPHLLSHTQDSSSLSRLPFYTLELNLAYS